ncbi:single-stranded-DNA-specific exonuclease RecJ [Flavobacteriaceae bacterium]|jgi:single-stranded-DNA-specific exonuclease|nr:single-stranded-DNA-specific exonuclease RecJ [Flavobacteriaceae bacterium]MDB4027314.1 single-stranded-DNA-specific exonuclease RecJ [bacterium]MDA9305525.1 single-stranded-DNA-specific exonuclease RecJ [Flavobacteriaceae bacterium]MDB4326608.1 single-stranded-DNA-specific exonuclease RecJ [Flavobacteriaceae bacterium]MDC6478313.1 single-stranded-DNA-specific exonuclease RecJ [Flavobacteriaceae bacterium]|tara:strand:- start:2218 stop:3915 length:1698 start_codon:yes stop_codon:yes gene_type:complete
MEWYTPPSAPENTVEHLSGALGVSPVIAQLLAQRGITSYEEAKNFFRPDWSQLHDPYLMQDMTVAVNRIIQAIERHERVMVYGDYDVDGTTSVALVYSFLKDKIENLTPYVPDRYKEGYGISIAGIDHAKEEGISLIIALDCGIKANAQIDYANDLGVDFVICDHHLPSENLPKAIAVLDPKRGDCAYPFKELCGCGIGFKLIQAVQQRMELPEKELFCYLDLVATAIAADIVPIIGENRILTFLGIEQLNQSPRVGLQFFLKSLKNPVSVTDLVFVIAPRINAAGRMDHGLNAVELLAASDVEVALPIARSIEFYNSERRATDERITKEALQQIILNEQQESFSTVVFHSSWHKGVIGIVASRLIETYYRPTVVLTESEGVLSGSVRSVRGFDVYKALESCAEFMIQFGGHKYAAGLTLKPEQLEGFKKGFEAYVRSTILKEQQTPSLIYDAVLKLNELSPKLLRILNQMGPFGPKNMRPVFVTHHCKDTGGSRLVGKDQTHLKLEIRDSSGIQIQGIGFGMGANLITIKNQLPFSVLYTLEENEYNGIVSLQLKVKDLKFEEV